MPPYLVLTVLFSALALFWLVLVARMVRAVLDLPTLPPLEGSVPGKVSVVIAARDEEEHIEDVVRRFLAQKGVAVEVIVVSDRSVDRTPDILRRLADEDGRVRPVLIDALPERWLGKCHACHQGSLVASGDWLLFTDADAHPAADLVARAVQFANAEGVQHVCMMFNARKGTLIGRACQMMFYLGAMMSKMYGVNHDRPGSFAGVGAFNMVQPAAYRASGGHEALRLTVIEDGRLGTLIRRAGFRTRLFHAGDELTADWSATPLSMLRLLEKNLFGAADYSLPRVSFGCSLVLGTWSGTLLGPFTLTVAGFVAFAALMASAVPAVMLARRSHGSTLSALLVPLCWPMMAIVLLNSTWKTLRQGGVRWRDTFYPLAMLREGNVRE